MIHGRVLIVFAIFACIGCAPAERKFPPYNVIRLYNESPGEIYNVELSAGGTTTVLDHLPPEHSPVTDRGISPDPATASVSWRTADGNRFGQQVPIAARLPRAFRGVVVLRLMESGDVEPVFVPYEDLK